MDSGGTGSERLWSASMGKDGKEESGKHANSEPDRVEERWTSGDTVAGGPQGVAVEEEQVGGRAEETDPKDDFDYVKSLLKHLPKGHWELPVVARGSRKKAVLERGERGFVNICSILHAGWEDVRGAVAGQVLESQ